MDRRDLLKNAVAAVEEMRARVEAAERATTEPIAIVGIGCRLPGGVSTPDELWELLAAGRDAITEVPEARWAKDVYEALGPEVAASLPRPHGGFLDGFDEFDPHFFSISPREAASMDPQHRMVLESSWHALEDAAIAPDRLRGSQTGVFIGITAIDYPMHVRFAEGSRLDVYAATGAAHNAAAGRVSYLLGLQGPSMAIDTACSSSLTAVHVACQNLRLRECDLALAGGVNTIVIPDWFVSMTRWGMLSPDGRCRAFDRDANGMVRSEGCGIVALKRLSDAEADGDRVLAVILGSAVNQDGASGGLTIPNGRAQEALVRQALRVARVQPAEVSYVEAHGTGTPIGDPIELEALDAVMSEGRPASSPLMVGSIKTNLGHLESAAGIAGLIKVVLSLQHDSVPRHLHFTELNPAITLRSLSVLIPREPIAWPREQRPRIAGVSSFGLSGTNAHVVLRDAEPAPAARSVRDVHLLTLSTRTEAGLRRQAGRWRDYLQTNASLHPGDVAHTANTGRAALTHRLTILARSTADFVNHLDGIAKGVLTAGTNVTQTSRQQRPRVAMMFTGQGSQYVGMGRDLYASQPVFRAAFDRCNEVLQPLLGRSLTELMHRDPDGVLDQTASTQPALFALEYALYEMWRGWGISPAAVMGHSVGEYVAACVAGVFSLEDGLRLIAERGRVMQQLPGGGAMVAVLAPEAKVRSALQATASEASIAAVNGPENIVMSGAAEAIGRAVAALEAQGIACRPLTVSHAFHSSLMDPVLPAFAAFARTVTFAAPQLPMVSNVTGQFFADGDVPDAQYWTKHLREAVRFSDGVSTLERAGYTTVLEVGPTPALTNMARRVAADPATTFVSSLRREQNDWAELLTAAGALYRAGSVIDWDAVDRGQGYRPVSLPTYPFERERCWIESGASPIVAGASGAAGSGASAGDEAPLPALYAVQWRAAELPVTQESVTHGSWIVVGNSHLLGDTLARRLRDAGASVRLVPNRDEAATEPIWRRLLTASSADGDALAQAVASCPAPRRVVLVTPFAPAIGTADAAALRASMRAACESVLQVAQALSRRAVAAQLMIVTRDAQAVGVGAGVDVAQAAVWGLGRALRVEHPELRSMLVDAAGRLPIATDSIDIETLWRALTHDADEQAVRGDVIFTPRLTQAPGLVEQPMRADGSYIVTGGFGALGRDVARSLIRRGAQRVVLVGRSARSAAAARVIDELAVRGATIRAVAGDVGDAATIAEAIAAASALAPLRGVVHAAGVNADRMFAQQDWTSVEEVCAAKVIGAWHLHDATRDLALDLFTMFSSSAALMPTMGQANYAAANAALDAIAHQRHALGLPAASINWGPWADAGMAARLSAKDRERWRDRGIGLISPGDGIRRFEQVAGGALPQVAVLPISWDRFFSHQPEQRTRQLLLGMQATGAAQPAAESLTELIAALPPSERRRAVYRVVCDVVRNVLAVSPAFVFEPNQGLRELGLDSLMAVELRNALQRRSGCALPSTLAFDCPDLDALTDFISRRLDVEAAPQQSPAVAASAIAREVEELSDQDAEALLAEELNK